MNNPKISVITICYNAENTIEKTLLSVINQSYSNIEYIIIDGASSDRTMSIIENYKNHIARIVSEPDKGIYDAMNKGVLAVTGEWINFMNAGDVFLNDNIISDIFVNHDYNADVIYGDSVSERNDGSTQYLQSSDNIALLSYYSIYRHGASFVRSSVHKTHLFDVARKDLGFALDYNLIHQLYREGYRFERINQCVMKYLEDGASNNSLKSAIYDYRINCKDTKKLKHLWVFLKRLLRAVLNIFNESKY